MKVGQTIFLEIDVFDFSSFFGLDFFFNFLANCDIKEEKNTCVPDLKFDCFSSNWNNFRSKFDTYIGKDNKNIRGNNTRSGIYWLDFF